MPGNIHVPISFSIDGLDKSVTRLNRLGKTMSKIGSAFAAAGAVAATAFGRFAGQSVQGSMELERNLEGLRTVFGNTTDQMVAFSESAANLGLSMSEAAKASTFIGSVLKQSGFAMQETADLTEELVTLGADLALTYGYDIQEALLGMTALFRGEYDPIEKFGVAMKQSEIDAEKAARGLDGLTGAAERFADQQIRLEFLMERSSDAQGALERQSENLAVKQMQLNSAFLNLRDTVTLDLLPVFAQLTGSMTDQLIRATPVLRESFAQLAVPMQRIADNIGPVLENILLFIADAISNVATFLTEATDPTTELGDAFQEFSNRLTLAAEAIQPVIDGIVDFFEQLIYYVFGDRNPIEFLLTGINQIIDGFSYFFTFLQVAIDQDIIGTLFDAFVKGGGGTDSVAPVIDNFFGEIEGRMQNRANRLADMNLEQDIAFEAEEQARARIAAMDDYVAYLEDLQIPEVIDPNFEDTADPAKASAAATDYVAEFFAALAEEVEKQKARLELQGLGLEDALIEQVLNSEGWLDIYDLIVEGGERMIEELNETFFLTLAGMEQLQAEAEALAEAIAKTQEEMASLNEELAQLEVDKAAEIAQATEEFLEFKESVDNSVDALQTYTREIGQFEQQTRQDLARIEEQLQEAFDNGYLLEEAKNNLLSYARAELGVLIDIQRQRDELLLERNAAADLIFGVARAVTASGQITNLLKGVQDEVEKVQVKELFEDVVNSADGLKEFKLTVERNYTETVRSTISQSAALVSSFQDVVDRTRKFIDNLKELRKLGLDPFLFNQLVEAGADAGGATAQALVEGGADTVNQVNALQAELEAMGVELGEQSYEVTKNSGEQFVSGIVDGLDAKLEDLENTAMTLAASFSQTFAAAMSAGMDIAFEQIKSEIESLFDALMAELEAKLAEMRATLEAQAGYTSPVTIEREDGGASTAVFDPITGELLRSYTDTTGALLEGGMVNPDYFADYPQLFPGQSEAGTTFINNIINANNPLDAYNASKGNVEQQSTFQSANGNINVTLSGVGS